MRAVVQRVHDASVGVDGEVVARIGRGLLVYLGVESGDGASDAGYVADKVRHLRVFPDGEKPMHRDVVEVGGSVLVVSAFTTAGDARRGRRPSFERAAAAEVAKPLYERFCEVLGAAGPEVERGRFGALMDVASRNDGPVCVLIDSHRVF